MRYAQQVTAFPASITTGSTWDTSLFYAFGNALGMPSIDVAIEQSVDFSL